MRARPLSSILPVSLVSVLLIGGCPQDPAPSSDETETDTGEPSCLDTDAPGDDIIINFDSEIEELQLGECVPERILITGGGITDLSGLASLREVGVLEIRFTPLLEDLAGLEQLERVGTLIITGNGKLTALPSFDALASAGTVLITGNTVLEDLGSFPALGSLGNLEISSNPLLGDYGGFEALTSTSGYVELWDSALIEDLSGFESLSSIGGKLRIEDMPVLTSLGGIGVTSIGGELRIVSNLELSECLVEDFAAAVSVGGPTILSGNKSALCE